MGPSISNPDTFKQRNRQRHLQAYQRKHRTQISLDSKIKVKNISEFVIGKNRQTSQNKIQMKRQEKTIQSQPYLLNNKKNNTQNQQNNQERLQRLTQKAIIQQNITKNIQKTLIPQTPHKQFDTVKINQESVLNTGSKQTSTRKIVLNNQSYQIDVQKMKNRRLRNKQRFTNSILSNIKNGSKIQAFHTKPSISTGSFAYGVSTLELQSQLHPLIHHNNSSSVEVKQNILQNISGQGFEKVLESKILNQNEKQLVRAEYYDQFPINNKHQQKLRQSKSDSKLIKQNYKIKTQKIIPKNEQVYEYYYKSEKQIKSKKQLINQVKQGYKQTETMMSDSQREVKKPVKIIKVHKH